MSAALLLRRLARRAVSRGVILLYHRVVQKDFDPQLLCVSPGNFTGHMDVLRSTYRAVRLQDLTEPRPSDAWSPCKVAVTFDDGYADNILYANPILDRYGIPATIFVTSGLIGTDRQPYWDELAYLFLRGQSLPPKLELTINDEKKSWEFGNEPPVDERWNLLQQSRPGRQSAYQELSDRLRSLPEAGREGILSQVRAWGSGVQSATPLDRFLTAEELVRLSDNGQMEIGAHTVTHSNLAILPAEEQRAEIVQGKRWLEDVIQRKVKSFAYPYGGKDNYTRQTIDILKAEGFDCACSNFASTVWFGTDRYQLPRMLVRNWPAEEFADRLDRFLGAG